MLPYRLGQPSRRELARTRRRLRREARARRRRMQMYPASRVSQVRPGIWQSARTAVAALGVIAAFEALALGAWWLL